MCRLKQYSCHVTFVQLPGKCMFYQEPTYFSSWAHCLAPEDICICDLIWKTHQIVTFGILRNADFKYSSHCSSLMLDCSHARYTV